jgi:hypothetical protein
VWWNSGNAYNEDKVNVDAAQTVDAAELSRLDLQQHDRWNSEYSSSLQSTTRLDEGESRMSRTKQDAYDALNLAPETIETKLTFQHYVTIISQNMPLIGDTKS